MASAPSAPRTVRVPFERLEGWLGRYDAAHPDTRWAVAADEVLAESPDGTRVVIAVPFEPLAGTALADLVSHVARPWRLGLLLVRRGGFAVARLHGSDVIELKIGRRHVQGRTKAGGWSQQRFARRRANQAKAAFDAAAEHAVRILSTGDPLDALATGGDRQAVSNVLDAPELARLRDVARIWLGGLPDPTRAVVDRAILDARSVEITITDPSNLAEPSES